MAGTYLTRTMNQSENTDSDKKFTYSGWIKKSETASDGMLIEGYYNSTFHSQLYYQSNGALTLNCASGTSGAAFQIVTNRLLRDCNAWYHIVVAIDTTQGTASDRAKIYINGVQETSFSSATYPNQNTSHQFNRNGNTAYLGRRTGGGTGLYFDGLMSHIHTTIGYTYDPTAFGQYDANGVWTIKTSPSVTYGTNGFFIFKDNGAKTDQSGNSNNFSEEGTPGIVSNTQDCPSNVFATANAIDNYYQNFSFTNGNTAFTTNSSSNTSAPTKSTIGVNSGKYYWEVKCVGISSGSFTYATIGITSRDITTNAQGNHLGSQNEDYAYYSYNGHILNNAGTSNTGSAYGNTYTTGDIIGVALDLDNNKLYFSKNGVWQNSGVPTSGSTGTGAVSIALPTANNGKGNYFTGVGDYHFSPTYSFAMNFGNGYFGTTAVSSAGTNASGNGIFEYDVPTGYTALSTKGLNL